MLAEVDAIIASAQKVEVLKKASVDQDVVNNAVLEYIGLKAGDEIKPLECAGILIKNNAEIIKIDKTGPELCFDEYRIFEATKEKLTLACYKRNCKCENLAVLKTIRENWYTEALNAAEVVDGAFYEYMREYTHFGSLSIRFNELILQYQKATQAKFSAANETTEFLDLIYHTDFTNFRKLYFTMQQLQETTLKILRIQLKTCCVSFLKFDLLANTPKKLENDTLVWVPFFVN